MRILLRDSATQAYLGDKMTWVENAAWARSFASLDAAARMTDLCGREEVDVVLSYDNPNTEVALNPAYCRSRPTLGTYWQSA